MGEVPSDYIFMTKEKIIVSMFYRIVSLLGGLAMFLYGMRIMGDGLKSSSGGAMKAALAKITNRPAMGFLLGMLVTCMIQSSTATIVLTVGLVGAGFITFRQSIGVVLGANVGTAITAQIIRLMDVQADAGSILYFFKSDNLAPMALIIGIILIMFVGSRSAKSAGTVCMGFGILFVGLMNMSASVSQFGEALKGLLISFEGNYILGFLSGVVVTGVIQSSSAVIGILQSIASSVGMRFCGVIGIIIGVNIGDCLTTYLVCRIGAKTEQIRTCMVHIIYNICAAALIIVTLTLLRVTGVLGDDIWYMGLRSGGIANVHGLFRLVPAVCLLPFTGFFAGLAEKLVPEKEVYDEDSAIKENLRKLDNRLLDNPSIAMNETSLVLEDMIDVALHNFTSAMSLIDEYDEKRYERISEREDLLDVMASATNRYLVSMTPYITLQHDQKKQNYQMQALLCLERIGDLALNIADCFKELNNNNLKISDIGYKELMVGVDAVNEILEMTAEACRKGDVILARQVEPLEEVIDALIEKIHDYHVYRVTHKNCDIVTGISFQNILLNLERVSDQCSDLAVYLLGRYDDRINGNEHQYLHDLHHSDDREYLEAFEEWKEKYFGKLKELQEEQEKEQ